jgi:hypothetical protein
LTDELSAFVEEESTETRSAQEIEEESEREYRTELVSTYEQASPSERVELW